MRKAGWLYFCFTMSCRDVEDLLADHGVDVSYETVRLWVLNFRSIYAHHIRRRREPAFDAWRLTAQAKIPCSSKSVNVSVGLIDDA